jgi:hypothetical protein
LPGFAERGGGAVEDHVEVAHGHAHAGGALLPVQILDEPEAERFGVAGVDPGEGEVDRALRLVRLQRAVRAVGGGRLTVGLGGHGLLQPPVALPGAPDVDGTVDGDATDPEVDAPVFIGFVLLAALEDEPEGVPQDVLRELPDRDARQDDLTVERIAVPAVERAGGGAFAPLEPGDDLPLLVDGCELCFVVQGASSAPDPSTAGAPDSYTSRAATARAPAGPLVRK